MTKIVYNACFGGFDLSDAAVYRYAKIKGIELYPEVSQYGFTSWWTVPEAERAGKVLDGDEWVNATAEERTASNRFCDENQITPRDIKRDDPALVQVVEELGQGAAGKYSALRVADVPAGERYRIDEYDGSESVMTVDDYDWTIAS